MSGPWRLFARQARADLGPLLTLLVLVAVTAVLAAAVPRQLTQTADEALGGVVDAAPAAAQEIVARSVNSENSAQFEQVDRTLLDQMSPGLRSVLGDQAYSATTPLHEALDTDTEAPVRPRPYAWLQVRYQEGLLDAVRWIDGRAPATGRIVEVPGLGAIPEVEVALERTVAKTLGLGVGSRILLSPVDEPLPGNGPFVTSVTGTFEAVDPDRRVWEFDPFILKAGQRFSADGQLLAEYGTALVSRGGFERLQLAAPTMTFEWHYTVRTDALNAGNVDEVQAGIRQTTAQGVRLAPDLQTVVGVPPVVTVESGMLDLLQSYLDQGATAEAVSSLVLAGLFVLALLVVGLATQMIVQRREVALRLARARGASVRQTVGVMALEALLVAVPGAVAGYLLAVLLVQSRPAILSVVLPAALVIGCVAFVALGTARVVRRDTGTARDDVAVTRPSKRRLALEALVVGISVTGLVLVRVRGVGGTDGADPLLAAVPVLLAVSAGILALRAYPWLLRPLVRLVRRRSGAVSFVSLARAARQPPATALPLVVLLLGLGFSVFASAVETTVVRGQLESSWSAVGADYRLDSFGFADVQVRDVEDVPGVDAVAPALVRDDVKLYYADGHTSVLRFIAVDRETYAGLTADAPSRVVPSDQVEALPPAPRDDALGGLVSPGVAQAAAETDGVVEISMPAIGFVDVTPNAVTDLFPTVVEGEDFIVVDLAALRRIEDTPVRATTLFVSGDPGIGSDVREAAGGAELEVEVTDRLATLSATTKLPFVGATVSAFRLGVAAAAGYCLLAVLLALVLTASSRARLLAVLRTLGTSRRQGRAMMALELAPIIGVVVLCGVAVGVALPFLLVPAVDLAPFTGGDVPPPRVDLPLTLALAAGLLVVVAIAVLLTTALERRRRLGETVRIGADT